MDEYSVADAIQDLIYEMITEDGYVTAAKLKLIDVLRKFKEEVNGY